MIISLVGTCVNSLILIVVTKDPKESFKIIPRQIKMISVIVDPFWVYQDHYNISDKSQYCLQWTDFTWSGCHVF